MADQKRTLKIAVMSFEEMRAYSIAKGRALDAGIDPRESMVAFVSQDLLWKKFTPKRLEVLDAMVGTGPMSIRELSRRLARDVKAVHGDVQILLQERLIVRKESGQIELPYDEVRLEVAMKAPVAA